jgi:hypothetical protein
VKLRLPSWLSDCGAALALLALAMLLAAPASSAAPTAATTYLSAAGAADDSRTALAKQRLLIRTEVLRWLRSGRAPADRLSAVQPAPPPSLAQGMPPSGSPLVHNMIAGERAARPTAHYRPAPTGPPALG